MEWISAAVVLLVLTSGSPVKAGKCPKECSCDNAKLSVACVGRNLTEIPPTIDEITVKLNLRNNNLQMILKEAFIHTPHLTHLNLQLCNIIKVKEGAFRSLGRLLSLNLANNKIDVLYQESFDGLSSLKELHLDHNRIEEIQPGAFAQLGFLNMLTLTHNQLVYIPNMAFQGLQNIKRLRLSHNSLNNLAPEAFAGLFSLRRLSLDHNELQFFPTQTMTRLPEVTHLDMSYNPMIYLGEESVSMGKLTHLHLHHMALQDLSDEAFAHAHLLSHIDLSHNQLRYLEPLSGPKELTNLSLTGNPIYCNCYLRPLREWATAGHVKLMGACAGPPHLSDEPLQAVTSLDLRCRGRGEALEEEDSKGNITSTTKPRQTVRCPSNCDCDKTLETKTAKESEVLEMCSSPALKRNFIKHSVTTEAHHATCESRGHTKIPRGFPSSTQLLDLRGNHFHFIPASSFPGSAQVVSLHLEFCKVREMEGRAFQGMKGLLYLYLSDNDLTTLDPRAFAGVPMLTYLHLEGNRLTHFPGPALSLLPNLFVLHLERNAISKLEPSGLLSSVAPTLRGLYLSNNTITGIAKGALCSASIGTVHLDSNQLTEVPIDALFEAPNLEELNLSHNPVTRVGPKAFEPVSQSLKRLFMDQMETEQMSEDALLGLGPGLKSLTLRGNHLKVLPDLSSFTSLEVIDLRDNPLLCDCNVLPLRRWMKNVRLEVSAMCSHPLELRGQQVRDINIFTACPEKMSPPNKEAVKEPRPAKLQKAKPSALRSPRVRTRPQKAKLDRPAKSSHQRKSATTAKNKKMGNNKN